MLAILVDYGTAHHAVASQKKYIQFLAYKLTTSKRYVDFPVTNL